MIFFMLFRVSGHSMEPTFKPGQILLVSSIPYFFTEPKVGDVVVIKDPRDKKPLLKRITKIEIATPRQGGARNDKRIYFVSGDNPKDSMDSRVFGPVTKEQILAKAIFTLHTI